MKYKYLIVTALIATAFAFTLYAPVDWQVNSDYTVKTSVGNFKGLRASISFDEEHPERSVIKASIDARTVDSGNDLKNQHSKEKGALDVELFPTITFASTSVRKISGDDYEATGNLTLKGITREIKLPFTFSSKHNSEKFPFFRKQVFTGRFTIVTKSFGIIREGAPKEVEVELFIPVRQ